MINKIPSVKFNVRVRDDSIQGDNPFKWVSKSSEDYFSNKKSILFSLPGAFTPTCSTFQLPDFNKLYNDFKNHGIDEIYCLSVNDSFVMNAWANHMKIQNVKMIPDGSGNFTRFMGMLIGKNHLGFGNRSWRYMAVINNGVVERWWQEPGINNEGIDDDPYIASTPENMINYLKEEYAMGNYGDYSGIDHNN